MPGSDADLEHAIARLDAHLLDRANAAGLQRRAEGQVVDRRELLVDARDEIVLDGSHGQLRGSAAGGQQLSSVARLS